jgi:hypothetical protein
MAVVGITRISWEFKAPVWWALNSHEILVGLGPADDDAAGVLVHHPHEHVRVGLFRRALAAIPLDVGHGPLHHHVLLLHPGQEILEAPVVAGAVRLVAFVGDRIEGVEAVHAHAALEAGGGAPPQQALHVDLLHQVVGALVDVVEAAYPLPGEVGVGEEQVLRLRFAAAFVGLAYGAFGRADQGMLHRVENPLAHYVDPPFEPAQALQIGFRAVDLQRHLPPPMVNGGIS